MSRNNTRIKYHRHPAKANFVECMVFDKSRGQTGTHAHTETTQIIIYIYVCMYVCMYVLGMMTLNARINHLKGGHKLCPLLIMI